VPGKVSGVPLIKGTRISVDQVIASKSGGESIDGIAYNFDLKSGDMRAVLSYRDSRPLARFLAHHQVIRSAGLGWSLFKNGERVQAAEEEGFEVMVTADRNLAYQQNLQGRPLAIVVLPSGRWPAVEPQVPALVGAVDGAKPRSYIEVSGSDPGRRELNNPRI
jgi:uncharacterized protein (DUF433 family)